MIKNVLLQDLTLAPLLLQDLTLATLKLQNG